MKQIKLNTKTTDQWGILDSALDAAWDSASDAVSDVVDEAKKNIEIDEIDIEQRR